MRSPLLGKHSSICFSCESLEEPVWHTSYRWTSVGASWKVVTHTASLCGLSARPRRSTGLCRAHQDDTGQHWNSASCCWEHLSGLLSVKGLNDYPWPRLSWIRCFQLLPSGRQYRIIKSRMTRLKQSFFPGAVKVMNIAWVLLNVSAPGGLTIKPFSFCNNVTYMSHKRYWCCCCTCVLFFNSLKFLLNILF